MSPRPRSAVAIWRARSTTTTGDRLYLGYLLVAVAGVVVAPLARALWQGLTGAEGIAALTASTAPASAGLIVAAVWAAALLLGRERGPALLPPFLLHALATSDLPYRVVFRGPLLRCGALVVAICTGAAGLTGASLAHRGFASAEQAVVFTIVGALVGVVASAAWLAGQTHPRVALPVAIGVVALASGGLSSPALQTSTPWGWVGLAYPLGTAPPLLGALAGLVALALVAIAVVPALLSRLRPAETAVQAARWQAATSSALGTEFGAAATVYRKAPHVGRRVRAVRPGHGLGVAFFVRDAIGAARTPGRLVVGLIALGVGGLLLGYAVVSPGPGWLLGAAAGLIVFAATGPLTDGIRHAAAVAADAPLYGIGDGRLLVSHSMLPLAVVVLVLVSAAVVVSLSAANGAPILSAMALGVTTLLLRVGQALKGPLPPVLLTPISSPMGDPMAAVRVLWALDGLLFAAVIGAAATVGLDAPLALLAAAGLVAGVVAQRWRHRA